MKHFYGHTWYQASSVLGAMGDTSMVVTNTMIALYERHFHGCSVYQVSSLFHSLYFLYPASVCLSEVVSLANYLWSYNGTYIHTCIHTYIHTYIRTYM